MRTEKKDGKTGPVAEIPAHDSSIAEENSGTSVLHLQYCRQNLSAKVGYHHENQVLNIPRAVSRDGVAAHCAIRRQPISKPERHIQHAEQHGHIGAANSVS